MNNFKKYLLMALILLGLAFVGYALGAKFGRMLGHHVSEAKYRIGIIDSGYNVAWADTPLTLCNDGHYDFVARKPGIPAYHPHGSWVGSIIADELFGIDYCTVIYTVIHPEGFAIPYDTTDAIVMASEAHLDAVNMSMGGTGASFLEYLAIKKLTANGTKLFVAAGNNGIDLNAYCYSYPPCFNIPGMFVVGAFGAPYSNYGELVKLWFPGDFMTRGLVLHGTSFASPRALADYIRSLDYLEEKGNH